MLNDGRFTSPIVSCEWLNEHRNLKHLVILDASVRKTDADASEGYIPNSRHFDIKERFSDSNDAFPNAFPSQEQFQYEARQLGINSNSLIVVYDNVGVYWSPRAWWLFKSFGFENVAVLDGGLPEWKRLNLESVASLAPKIWDKGNFKADYQPDKMRFFHHILEISKDETCSILDARSEERFKGIVPEPRVGLRSGTIPNSANLPYTNVLNGHCLKSEAELKLIFDAFSIEDKALTFSCGSGITACILALAAEIAGCKKLSVYDGSWTEYGTLTHE